MALKWLGNRKSGNAAGTGAGTAGDESFLSHLVELRDRMIKSLIVVLILFGVCFYFSGELMRFLSQPLYEALPKGTKPIFTDQAGAFFTLTKMSFLAALLCSLPWVLYQAWAFVAPGLYQNEKRLARPLLWAAVLLFYIGCAFAFFLVLPAVFGFLTAITPAGVAMMTDISRYLDFVLVIFLAFGLSFEMPVAVVVLVLLGVVTPAQLREFRGYVVVGIFILAAVITPPDVVSQLMLAIPMCLLYELGILVSSVLRPARAAA